jgi:hypothetical protein
MIIVLSPESDKIYHNRKKGEKRLHEINDTGADSGKAECDGSAKQGVC